MGQQWCHRLGRTDTGPVGSAKFRGVPAALPPTPLGNWDQRIERPEHDIEMR